MLEAGAIHLTADDGDTGEELYLKCVPVRGESAGSQTGSLAGANHLIQRRTRVQEGQKTSGPIVTVPYVDFVGDPSWLVTAMERLQPLHKLIEAGGTDAAFAVALLRTLAAEYCDGWFHYDLCPRNLAVRADGAVVFIDIDSYFPLSEGDEVNISLGAHKLWRVPPDLRAKCRLGFELGQIDRDAALRKHDCEVILVAAECCLGLYSRDFDAVEIDPWCDASHAEQDIRDLWKHELHLLCANGKAEPARVAAGLQALRPFQPRSTPVDVRASTPFPAPAEPAVETAAGRNAPLDFNAMVTWEDFGLARRTMRERALSQQELREYGSRLWDRARSMPGDRRWWVELLMLTLTFNIDLEDAIKTAGAALEHFPDDEEFSYDLRMARRWRNVR